MAVKDLNDLRYDKITGDKLYAIEWNTIVKSLQDHIKNFDIHQPITINEEDNTLSYKEGDKIYTFALNRKTGERWGPLLINYIKRGDSTITEDNNHYYNIENIPATSAENIIELLVSFKQQKYIDSVPQEGIFQYPANTVTLKSKSDIQGFSISISDTDNDDNVKKLTITVPNNNSYTEAKEYNFEIEGSIGEGADDKKLVQFKLTQNAIGETWEEPYIDEIRVNNGNIPPNEIPSAQTNVTIEVIVKQKHNGQVETPNEFTLTYDYNGDQRELNENQSSFTITIPQNTNESTQDRSLDVLTIVANGRTKENAKITLTQVADEIDSYGEVIITGFSYNNLNYGTKSSVSPSSSLQCKQEITWKSGNITYTTDGLTKSYSNSTISDSNVTVNPNNGTVTKTTANEDDSEITLGNVLLTVTGQNNNSNTATATVKQNGTPMPDLIYGQIPIEDETALETFISNPSSNINDTLINSNFTKVSTFSDGNLTIGATAANNDYVALCFLIKDTSKNFYKVTPIPGMGDLHDEFNECGFNPNLNYKGTYTYNSNTSYKLYISFFDKIESAETNRYYISANKKQ